MESINSSNKELSPEQRLELLRILRTRFENNLHRHRDIHWGDVQTRLEANPDKMWSLHQMEQTGGEPDVIGHDAQMNEFIFYDCSPESPQGRRNVCYDHEALESRKDLKPENSALNMAEAMGIVIMTEEQYRYLQTQVKFDTKTSSWL